MSTLEENIAEAPKVASFENVPTPPFSLSLYPCVPILANTAIEWLQGTANTTNEPDSTNYSSFNPDNHSIRSKSDSGDDSDLRSVIGYFPPQAQNYVSYICVSGGSANYVDVTLLPNSQNSNGKYQGWNGVSFEDGPAVNVDGYYWYRLEVYITQEAANDYGTNVFFAKNYRGEVSGDLDFDLWAYISPQNPDHAFPVPPFSTDQYPLTPNVSDSPVNWMIQTMQTGGLVPDVRSGQFNLAQQSLEAQMDNSNVFYEIVGSTTPMASDFISFVCVGGPGAKYVDVSTVPNATGTNEKYQGWNGKEFADGIAIEENGYFWYRKEVKNSLEDAEEINANVFFAKTYRAPQGKHQTFWLWSYTGLKQ